MLFNQAKKLNFIIMGKLLIKKVKLFLGRLLLILGEFGKGASYALRN